MTAPKRAQAQLAQLLLPWLQARMPLWAAVPRVKAEAVAHSSYSREMSLPV
jgi:hypothetical protein